MSTKILNLLLCCLVISSMRANNGDPLLTRVQQVAASIKQQQTGKDVSIARNCFELAGGVLRTNTNLLIIKQVVLPRKN